MTAIPQMVSAITNLLKSEIQDIFMGGATHNLITVTDTTFFYNFDCLVMENMYWMSCDFEEGKDCTRSLSKQPCYLGHKVKFFVICFVLSLITVSNFLSLS